MSDGARLYYSPPEYQILLDSTPKRRTYFATRLEAECSPRIGLVSQIERGDFFIPLDPDVELVFLKIRDGKDTTDNEDGGSRITWVPFDLFEEIEAWCDRRSIGEDEQIFEVGAKTLSNDVIEMGENAATKTGDEDFLDLTTHDNRAYYATNMIRRLGVDKEIVKSMGGWSSDKAIEPYLDIPLEKDIQDELVRAGVVQKDVSAPPRRDDLAGLYRELRELRKQLHVADLNNTHGLDLDVLKEIQSEALAEEGTEEDSQKIDNSTLSNYLAVSDPATAGAAITAEGVEAAEQRARREKRAMEHDPNAADPTPSHLAKVFGLCVVAGAMLAFSVSASSFSPPVTAALYGLALPLAAGKALIDVDLEEPPE